jgi:NADH-quinone oxidoreductase subunit J
MSIELAAFYAIGAGSVFTALAMIMSRNVVHAVLFMIANFLLTGVLYLMLHAPFVAVAQVLVYAGAIMVLFLFVVMLMGGGSAGLDEPLTGQRALGLLMVALLGAILIAAASEGVPAAPPGGAAARTLPPEFGSPGALGRVLFADYVLGLEVVSVLLLVAIVGAVVIAHYAQNVGQTSDDGAQPEDAAE